MRALEAASDDVPSPPGLVPLAVTPEHGGEALGSGYRLRYAMGTDATAVLAVDMLDGRYVAFVPEGTLAQDLRWWLGERPLSLE